MRYLFLRGRTWYVRVVVPPKLRPVFQKAEIVRALGTRDRAEAQELRWAVVADIQTSIEKLRNARGDTGQLVARALKDRREAAASKNDEAAYEAIRDAWGAHRDELLEDDGEGDYRLRKKSDGKEYKKRDSLYALATGGSPSVEMLFHLFQLDAQFLGLKPKTRLDYKTATNFLVQHLGDVTAKNVTAHDAADFADELLKNKAPKTTAKYLSALSGLWKWARRKGFVGEANPWVGAMNVRRKTIKGQRAYTDAEVRLLLDRDGPQEAKDLTVVGLYTGCRLGEIVDALARDFDGIGLTVTDAKTSAGNRWVPITGKALAILKRRAQGKAGTEPLWPEYPPAALDGRRSHAASKRWLR